MPQIIGPITTHQSNQPSRISGTDIQQIIQVIKDCANSIIRGENFSTTLDKFVGTIPIMAQYAIFVPLIDEIVQILTNLTFMVKNIHDLADRNPALSVAALECICQQLTCLKLDYEAANVNNVMLFELVKDLNQGISFSCGNIASAIMVSADQNKLEDRLYVDPLAPPSNNVPFNAVWTATEDHPSNTGLNCGLTPPIEP